MQELELHDIDENEYRALFHEIPNLWKKNSGFFDMGLGEIFGTFGESNNLVFGVHIYIRGNYSQLFIVLTEYLRETRTATFRINVVPITRVAFEQSREAAEVRFRQILEKLTYEELETFAIFNQYQGSDEVFVCPKCKARYMMRTLKVSEDGKVQCQNCLALIDPNEIHVDNSHDS